MFDTEKTVKDVKGATKINQEGQSIKVNVSNATFKPNALTLSKPVKTSDDEYEDDAYNDFEVDEEEG